MNLHLLTTSQLEKLVDKYVDNNLPLTDELFSQALEELWSRYIDTCSKDLAEPVAEPKILN